MTPLPTPTADTVPRHNVFHDSPDCANLQFTDRLPMIPITISFFDLTLIVDAEVADDGAERGQGLMCRSHVPDGSGMLFVFDLSAIQTFWMFNTYQALDIVFLDEMKESAHAFTMEPCPRPGGASHSDWQQECLARQTYSTNPSTYALELPAGWLFANGIPLELIEMAEFEW